MHFENGHLYHIYNQGNNKQKIFFDRDNYVFFLRKIRTHMLPYCDVLAYCLMPNHFHLMVSVNEVQLATHSSDDSKSSDELATKLRTFNIKTQ
jgi:putative transposase